MQALFYILLGIACTSAGQAWGDIACCHVQKQPTIQALDQSSLVNEWATLSFGK